MILLAYEAVQVVTIITAGCTAALITAALAMEAAFGRRGNTGSGGGS